MSDNDETYNGWKNYPTWAVHLWLTNDKSEYDSCLRTVDDAFRHSDTPRVYIADALKESLFEAAPDLGASMYADLLSFALYHVDWFEIADDFIDACEEVRAVAADRSR